MCKGKGKIQNKISENLSSMYLSSRDITGLRKTNKIKIPVCGPVTKKRYSTFKKEKKKKRGRREMIGTKKITKLTQYCNDSRFKHRYNPRAQQTPQKHYRGFFAYNNWEHDKGGSWISGKTALLNEWSWSNWNKRKRSS